MRQNTLASKLLCICLLCMLGSGCARVRTGPMSLDQALEEVAEVDAEVKWYDVLVPVVGTTSSMTLGAALLLAHEDAGFPIDNGAFQASALTLAFVSSGELVLELSKLGDRQRSAQVLAQLRQDPGLREKWGAEFLAYRASQARTTRLLSAGVMTLKGVSLIGVGAYWPEQDASDYVLKFMLVFLGALNTAAGPVGFFAPSTIESIQAGVVAPRQTFTLNWTPMWLPSEQGGAMGAGITGRF